MTTSTEKPRYVDMTPDQRLAAYVAQREAANTLQDGFCATPWRNGTRAHNAAWDHMQQCEREAAFIERIARSRGDNWAIPTPRPRKITGRAALRVDDVTRTE